MLSIFNLIKEIWWCLWDADLKPSGLYCAYEPPKYQPTAAPQKPPVVWPPTIIVRSAEPDVHKKNNYYNHMLKKQHAREPGGYNLPVEPIRPHRQAPPHKLEPAPFVWPGYANKNDSSGKLPFEADSDEEERIVEEMARVMFGSYDARRIR